MMKPRGKGKFVERYKERFEEHQLSRINKGDIEDAKFTKTYREGERYILSLERNYSFAKKIFDIIVVMIDDYTNNVHFTYSDMATVTGYSVESVKSAVQFLCHNKFINVTGNRCEYKINSFLVSTFERQTNKTASRYRYYEVIDTDTFTYPNSNRVININDGLSNARDRRKIDERRGNDTISKLENKMIVNMDNAVKNNIQLDLIFDKQQIKLYNDWKETEE